MDGPADAGYPSGTPGRYSRVASTIANPVRLPCFSVAAYLEERDGVHHQVVLEPFPRSAGELGHQGTLQPDVGGADDELLAVRTPGM
jgi:hypothetical protein